jgi:hypothetical protein
LQCSVPILRCDSSVLETSGVRLDWVGRPLVVVLAPALSSRLHWPLSTVSKALKIAVPFNAAPLLRPE